ncbi:hypothetical protein C1N92_20085 [Bacillus velezensis]|nr:hypothetical protein C0W57_08135 [Bacillus velezensis]AWQ17002.1 hypothetical protein C1N92_20085 [Bacillus velezensis]KAF1273277.1 hypothetical protein BUE72_19805 [Bacillus amyloliquefaciens]UOX38305.1 hypothetical protein [Bacillus phage BUCT083]
MNRKKENEDMNATVFNHCSPSESLEQSLKEMKLMREGKTKKRSYKEIRAQMKKDMDEGRL